MSRVINTDGPGKRRNQNMRTGAELLRQLSQKHSIDDETKDMVALLVFVLQEIAEGIDESARAWEKRDYWMKAEKFRQRWDWSQHLGDQLLTLVLEDDWQHLPELMVKLFPHFSQIKINRFMRSDSLWQGMYERLMRERPPEA